MSVALIILSKAPVAGLAKTRLIPTLGAQGAADFARQLLLQAVQQALHTPFEHLELCVSPEGVHPAFAQAQALAPGRLHLTAQGEGDLGARMHRALLRRLVHEPSVLLMGTDAPGLSADVLKAAARVLDGNDAVFVPAHDGGYALVGLRRPCPDLFQGMTWSTPQVMAETRLRARAAGLHWQELDPVFDMDEPNDLHHLPPDWPGRDLLLKDPTSP